MSKERYSKDDYEKEASLALELAGLVMRKDHPNYGEAESQIARAQQALKYARQINNRTYQGEEY